MLEMLSRNCLLKQKNYTSLIRNELGVSTLMTFLLLRLRSPLLGVYLINEYHAYSLSIFIHDLLIIKTRSIFRMCFSCAALHKPIILSCLFVVLQSCAMVMQWSGSGCVVAFWSQSGWVVVLVVVRWLYSSRTVVTQWFLVTSYKSKRKTKRRSKGIKLRI